MGMTWGRWRTRTVAAGLIGGVAYVLVLLAGDLWAAETASHDPPCFPSVSFSCFMPPSFFDVVGVYATSFLVGLIAIVAVHEVADRRVVRTPSGIERVLLATLLTVLFLPGLVAMAATAPRPGLIALVLAGPPAVFTWAYLLGPPPVPASFAVRHPFLARSRTTPLRTRVVRAGGSLRHLFVPFPPGEAPPPPPDVRRDLFSTTPREDDGRSCW